MEIFIINKSRFEIIKRSFPYAILKSLHTGHTLVYRIGGCNQYEKQFIKTKDSPWDAVQVGSVASTVDTNITF